MNKRAEAEPTILESGEEFATRQNIFKNNKLPRKICLVEVKNLWPKSQPLLHKKAMLRERTHKSYFEEVKKEHGKNPPQIHVRSTMLFETVNLDWKGGRQYEMKRDNLMLQILLGSSRLENYLAINKVPIRKKEGWQR